MEGHKTFSNFKLIIAKDTILDYMHNQKVKIIILIEKFGT